MNSNAALALDAFPDRAERKLTSEVVEGHVASERNLGQLSDDDLLASTRRLVGRSNQLFAALLAHLAEVEARGLHRLRACSSLYTYCIYELRFSEDAAFRRVSAARLVKRFPVLLDSIERGELHLTGLLMLGPHLTPANHLEVLARAKHRTKKELAKLVRLLDPLPDAPARIEPLGPALGRTAPANPSWDQVVQSMNPVRELNAGERPRDWVDGALTLEAENDDLTPAPPLPAPPARFVPPLAGPQRHRVQFTVAEEYIDLVDRAKALLSEVVPRVGLEELHLRAMRALVADLEKRKYAVSKPTPTTNPDEPRADDGKPRQRGSAEPRANDGKPRQRRRAVPAAVKRVVFERDERRCSYFDEHTGQRCRETHHLELHHQTAYARGGPHTASNLSLRCAAHNTLAAEADFGREFIATRKDAARHEAYDKQGLVVPAGSNKAT